MYIAPNSQIRLLQGIPLEPDYINTLYFANATAQYNYFSVKAKWILTAQSYQRVNKGVCRVNYKAEDLYDCNYLMFQNTSFGNKWFYAFITSVDYVNNVTSDVHYEIDVMQTWAFEMSLTRCFVEREHSVTDEIGDNIVPEPVETGELVFNHFNVMDKCDVLLGTYGVIVLVSDVEDASTIGTLLDGIFSGAKAFLFGMDLNQVGINTLRTFLASYIQKPDAIIGIYMVPLACLDTLPDDQHQGDTIAYNDSAKHRDNFDVMGIDKNSRVDGHVVRNMKLLTYPYNFCHVNNVNGRELNLRYEFFQDENGNRTCKPQFHMYGNITMPVTVVLRPKGYKGAVTHEQDDLDMVTSESIDLTNFPMCSWGVDSWMAWVAQNSVPETISAFSNATGMGLTVGGGALLAGASLSTAGVGALVAGAIGLASTVLSNTYKASIKADVCKGSLNNGNINFSSKYHTFVEGRLSVCREMAEIIDDFFDRFGYATNRVKIPNTHSRPQWNYVKTIGSNVNGNIPADDKQKIDANFNKGITFWKHPDNVDNYSLSNAPT